MRKNIYLPFLALGLLGFSIFHVVRAQQETPQLQPPVEPPRTPFKGTVAGAGVVEPMSENIAIGSHLAGVIAEVYVKVHDVVEQGAPLFKLDVRNLEAERLVRLRNLESAKASLQRLENQPRPEELPPLEAKVQEMRAQVENARDQFERGQKLRGGGAIGEEERMQRKSTVSVTEAQLLKAEKDLELLKKGAWERDKAIAHVAVAQSEALLKQTEIEIERSTMRAPIRGEILQKNIRPGEYVGNSPGQALLVLGDTQTLHIRTDVDENDLDRFREGMIGRATPRGNPSKNIQLRFVRVEPYLVPKKSLTGSGSERVDTRVLQVIYAVEASDAKLYVGQQVDVYLEVGGKKSS